MFIASVRTLLFASLLPLVVAEPAPVRPNLLWIIAEDMGPWLGCYGEKTVRTPHLDALAAHGIRFTQVWSGGAACSPSRSSLFAGISALALGTDTHREPRPVPSWAFFPQYLRQAGYYCTNNAKTDYNARPTGQGWWDASGRVASYINRPKGQPFFHCYSSLGETHMSCIIDHPLDRRNERRIDPASVTLPAWLPNLPALRDDRAWHLDWVEKMDRRVGDILAELKGTGEADNTIVFFFSDHGGCYPGGKGFAWDYGFRVPLITYFPPKWAHLAPIGTKAGSTCDRLVSFLDFGPTALSLAGAPAPDYFQGLPFAGPAAGRHRETALAFRGINGGRWDPVRTLRDERYVYSRNFLPHRPAGQRQDYQWRMPGQQAWELAWKAGQCNELQSRFWLPRPSEELYDLISDPEQTTNLASDPTHAKHLANLRTRLREELIRHGDIGLVPNSLRAPLNAPTYYDRMQPQAELRREILEVAWNAGDRTLRDTKLLNASIQHNDASIRYWAAVGLTRLAYEGADTQEVSRWARTMLSDPEGHVRVAAAEALCALGESDAISILLSAVRDQPNAAGREALAAIETLGPQRAAAAKDPLASMESARSTFFLRSALITLGQLPYEQLFRPGTQVEE